MEQLCGSILFNRKFESVSNVVYAWSDGYHGKEVRLIKRKEIGRKGEQVAADFLERRGFTIRDRNFYTRWGELDIVAVEKTEIVHFVEVKTRTGLAYGTPGTAVTYVKQQRIRTAALHWLQQENTYFPYRSEQEPA